jgi:hypothetical protein
MTKISPLREASKHYFSTSPVDKYPLDLDFSDFEKWRLIAASQGTSSSDLLNRSQKNNYGTALYW